MKIRVDRTRWTILWKTGKSPWSITKYDHTIKSVWWNGDLNNVGGRLPGRAFEWSFEAHSQSVRISIPFSWQRPWKLLIQSLLTACCTPSPSLSLPNAHVERERRRVCFKIQQVVRLTVTMLLNVLAFAIVSVRKRNRSSTWRPSTSATSEAPRNLRKPKRIWLSFCLRSRFEQSLWTFRVWYWRGCVLFKFIRDFVFVAIIFMISV